MTTAFKNVFYTGIGTSLNITAVTPGSPTTGSVTLTFAAQSAAPFVVGLGIVVSGVSISGYNGYYVVTACTTSSVTFSNATTGAPTAVSGVYGNITSSPLQSNASANTTVIGFSLTNISAGVIQASIQLQNTVSGTVAYYVNNVTIAPNTSLRAVTGGEKLILTPSTNVLVISNASNSVDCVMSWVEIS
jgi:hypothetical protein